MRQIKRDRLRAVKRSLSTGFVFHSRAEGYFLNGHCDGADCDRVQIPFFGTGLTGSALDGAFLE